MKKKQYTKYITIKDVPSLGIIKNRFLVHMEGYDGWVYTNVFGEKMFSRFMAYDDSKIEILICMGIIQIDDGSYLNKLHKKL